MRMRMTYSIRATVHWKHNDELYADPGLTSSRIIPEEAGLVQHNVMMLRNYCNLTAKHEHGPQLDICS